METFGSKLKQLRVESNLTQDELIEIINNRYDRSISKSMVSKWENGKEEPSRFRDVNAIAEYFGVTADYLIGVSNKKYTTDSISGKKIPVLKSIITDDLLSSSNNIDSYEFTTEDYDFCVKAYDDSMIGARICSGDIVFVHKQSDVENGEVAAIVLIDGKIEIKRIYKVDSNVILHSENPLFEDSLLSKKEFKKIKILGKVVAFKGLVK